MSLLGETPVIHNIWQDISQYHLYNFSFFDVSHCNTPLHNISFCDVSLHTFPLCDKSFCDDSHCIALLIFDIFCHNNPSLPFWDTPLSMSYFVMSHFSMPPSMMSLFFCNAHPCNISFFNVFNCNTLPPLQRLIL